MNSSAVTVTASAAWPESENDVAAPSLPGFIVSSFSPIAAETAARCMQRRLAPAAETVTAVIVVSSLGDVESAGHVAHAVAAGERVGPLLFFQSVPNAVAGHIAARWQLTGPVMCLGDLDSALDAAALLIEDGDADEALLVHVEQAGSVDERDRARAVLVCGAASTATGTATGTTKEVGHA